MRARSKINGPYPISRDAVRLGWYSLGNLNAAIRAARLMHTWGYW